MKLRQRTIDPLSQLDLFADCTPSEIVRTRQLLTMVTVQPGTVLIHEGRYGMEFLIIDSGEAAVSIGGRVVATLGRGDFVGEMSLLARDRRTATVTAVTPLTCYVANTAEFTALLEAAPGVGERIVRTAEARRETNRQAALAA